MRTGTVQRQFAAVALAVVAGSCAAVPPPPSAPTPAARASADVVQLRLTRDGGDLTQLSSIGEGVLATAPSSNTGSNSRWVFHSPAAAITQDEGACATVTHSGLPVQEGVALRVTSEASGRTRAITVTKNVWGDASWFYNVHVWDTADSTPLRQLGAFDMSAALQRVGAQPSSVPRLCARVIGDRVELKVWPATTLEPAWGDPVSTRSVRVDPEWVHAGAAGWYIGHLPPGGWAELTQMTTWVEAVADDPDPSVDASEPNGSDEDVTDADIADAGDTGGGTTSGDSADDGDVTDPAALDALRSSDVIAAARAAASRAPLVTPSP